MRGYTIDEAKHGVGKMNLDHPIVKRLLFAGALLSVLVTVIGAFFFLYDVRSSNVETQHRIILLAEKVDRYYLQGELSFEELEEELSGLRSDIATSQDDLNYRLGLLKGNLEILIEGFEYGFDS